MFIDASALVAILCQEPGSQALLDRVGKPGEKITSNLAIFEAVTALCRKKGVPVEEAEADVRSFLLEARVAIVPIAIAEGRAALAVFARYGKGRGHPAQLNMGDCFAYACARTHDVPLLFVGDDFSRTDIRSAMT